MRMLLVHRFSSCLFPEFRLEAWFCSFCFFKGQSLKVKVKLGVRCVPVIASEAPWLHTIARPYLGEHKSHSDENNSESSWSWTAQAGAAGQSCLFQCCGLKGWWTLQRAAVGRVGVVLCGTCTTVPAGRPRPTFPRPRCRERSSGFPGRHF